MRWALKILKNIDSDKIKNILNIVSLISKLIPKLKKKKKMSIGFNTTTPIPIYFERFVSLMTETLTSSDYSYDSADGCTTITELSKNVPSGVKLKCTSFIMPCMYISINGKNYLVKRIVFGESITVKGEILPDQELEIVVNPLNYFYGELKKQNIEMQSINEMKDLIPMLYMLLPSEEDFELKKEKGRYVDLKLLLLHVNDSKNWKVSQHWENINRAMYYAADLLCHKIYQSTGRKLLKKRIKGFADIDDSFTGIQNKNILSANFSGVLLSISFFIGEECNNCNC